MQNWNMVPNDFSKGNGTPENKSTRTNNFDLMTTQDNKLFVNPLDLPKKKFSKSKVKHKRLRKDPE